MCTHGEHLRVVAVGREAQGVTRSVSSLPTADDMAVDEGHGRSVTDDSDHSRIAASSGDRGGVLCRIHSSYIDVVHRPGPILKVVLGAHAFGWTAASSNGVQGNLELLWSSALYRRGRQERAARHTCIRD